MNPVDLALKAELTAGKSATIPTRLLSRAGQVPELIGKKYTDAVLYDTLYNQKGQSILKFFDGEKQTKIGLNNVQRGKMEGNDVFFLDSIRLLYATLDKSDSNIEEEADQVTEDKVISLNFLKKELPPQLINAELFFMLGNVTYIERLPLTVLSSGNTDMERGVYRLEQPYFLNPGKDFRFEINLHKGNLKNGEVLKMQLLGLKIKI